MSKLQLRKFKAQDAIEIISKGAKQPCLIADGWSEYFAEALEKTIAFTGIIDDVIVGCGGLNIFAPGRAEAWILLGDSVSELERGNLAHRIVKRKLEELVAKYELVRVQAPMRIDFEAGLRYARFLGFGPDGKAGCPAILKNYHSDGTDAIMYVILRNK